MTEPKTPASVAAAQARADATRAEIAATIDELVTRINPRTQASKILSGGQQIFADAGDPSASPDARRRAWIVLGAAAGLTAIAMIAVIRRIR